jgi:hypothetical protein
MKYVIIPYIALGLILSLIIGIEYNFLGQEMLPTYYGNPFVFKQKSLGSSMEYYYSISGLILNILTWSLALFIIDLTLKRVIQRIKKSAWINISYKVIIGFLIAFTTLNIAMDSGMIGLGFKKGLNYWYWNIDKEAKDWGGIYKGELNIFIK